MKHARTLWRNIEEFLKEYSKHYIGIKKEFNMLYGGLYTGLLLTITRNIQDCV